MRNHRTYDRQQFEKAGEQAGQIFGRLMAVATEFANEFGGSTGHSNNSHSNKSDTSTNVNSGDYQTTANRPDSQVLQEAGEHLQKMREAAGYTLDSFSAALESELNHQDHVEVVGKVKDAESGREALPLDWLNQVSKLLSNGDPVRFFEKLQESYTSGGDSDYSDPMRGSSNTAQTDARNDSYTNDNNPPPMSERVQKFSEIFKADAELDQLTNDQFEMLLGFVENSYRDARKLVSK